MASNNEKTVLDIAVTALRDEGFPGPQSFIFLTRYAALKEDYALLKLVGNTLETLDNMPASAALAYAMGEYFQAAASVGDRGLSRDVSAESAAFCLPAADYVLNSCDREDRTLAAAYAKCARSFGREDYMERAIGLLSDGELAARNTAFSALAYTELYRATFNPLYLETANAMADIIEKNFHSAFNSADVYDLEQPSVNSAVALMYDELSRLSTTPESYAKRSAAAEKQNSFIRKLAERYPEGVTFGLCALLAEEFEPKTVVCRFTGNELPRPFLSLLSFYSPVTELMAEPDATGEPGANIENSDNSARTDTGAKCAKYFLLNKGILEHIKNL